MGDNVVTTGGASYAVVPNNDGKVATQAYDDICKYLTETGLSAEDAKKVAALVVKLDKDLKVIDESDPDAPNEDGEYPILEAAADALVDAVDLAILAAKLKIDSEKFQAFVRKTELDHLNNELDSKIKERLEKIAKTLEQMDKAAKSSLFSKIFGWLMVAVSIILAIATCGAAGAVLIGAVVGAVVAITMQALTQAGVMEKLTKALVKSIMANNPGMSRREAEIRAAIIVTVVVLAVSLASGASPGSVGRISSEMFKKIAEVIKTVGRYLDPLLKVAGQAIQFYSAKTNFDLGVAQSESTYAKSMLKELMRKFELASDQLAEIVEQLMGGSNTIGDILVKTEDVKKGIALKMTMMKA